MFPEIKPKITRKAFLANPTNLIWADGIEAGLDRRAYDQSEVSFRPCCLSRSVVQRGDFGLGERLAISFPASVRAGYRIFSVVSVRARRSDEEWRESSEAVPGCSGEA